MALALCKKLVLRLSRRRKRIPALVLLRLSYARSEDALIIRGGPRGHSRCFRWIVLLEQARGGIRDGSDSIDGGVCGRRADWGRSVAPIVDMEVNRVGQEASICTGQ
jgi:hypothetical protein